MLRANNSNTNFQPQSMLRYLACSLLFVGSIGAWAQNWEDQFIAAFHQQDSLAQRQVLQQWEKAQPNNAELMTMYYNYYMQRARREIVQVFSTPPDGEALELRNEKGELSGYMGSEIFYEKAQTQQAIAWLDRALQSYPNRLDIRFGKIYALGLIEDWQPFTTAILEAIAHGKKINHHWLWKNNEAVDEAADFFAGSIQDYQVDLFNTQDDELLNNVRTIARQLLEQFPNHIESLSNIVVSYMYEKKYEQALPYLERAIQVDPEDAILVNNMAELQKRMGHYNEARRYYQRLIELIPEEKAQIENAIRQLPQ